MMRRLILWLGFLSASVIAALVVYKSLSKLPSDVASQTTFSAKGGRQLFINTKSSQSPKESSVPISPIEEPAWLTEARNDPDPRVRLNAIETWARNPGENLNPFTYALVDPDETVRTRAQELFEEALARR